MLPFLKKFKKENNTEDISDNEKNILITSLLIECAKGDYDFSDQEISKIKDLIKKKLKIDQSKVNSIFDNALEMVEENVEIYSLTKDIRDNFNKEEILEIFEYMWSVVLADGRVDDFEAALMTKLVGLFHLTGKESAEAKKKAMSHQ
ncbi:MAG: hypothetical protein CMP38_06555 [Rickettsiales bacterium]|nr:hypothetical protein [Rickettsiales bacterium]OUV99619.1 MAG: hypothetical protein CBD16_07905 [Betaproteobacteria bacterium TMED156]|tara:strand:- start:109 stop:549 length:441 start_codon:yes stop_codon:yes gene_type:complete